MMGQYLELLKEHQLWLKDSLESELEYLPKPVYDSRSIQPGCTFIAIKGERYDGHAFIKEASKQGASLIIGENGQCQIQVKDSRKAAALYAKLYYGRAAESFKLFGITGTNGKTTSSLMLYQLLKLQGLSCGWIGTLGYKINDEHYASKHTTPDILELHQIFRKMADSGVSHVVMEVSSHALALDRVYGVDFDYNLFSNLGRDHLDFHHDLEDYFKAKEQLFLRATEQGNCSIINTDDVYGSRLYHNLQALKAKASCIGHKEQDWQISDEVLKIDGSEFYLKSPAGEKLKIDSPLAASFNVDNLAIAIAAAVAAGADFHTLASLVPQLKAVPGRVESIENTLGIGIYVDYAHSPDAIRLLCKNLRELKPKRLISVFGAGGNRDRGKRPQMLHAALGFSDVVILCNDNPRDEEPAEIIRDILKDRELNLPWWIIRDRRQAIRTAIRFATAGDLVLICGKGHEDYQEIRGQRYTFDDRQVAREVIREIETQPASQKQDDELLLPVDPLLLEILAGIEQGGTASEACYHYLSTDSRNLRPGSVFFAIAGENFDGNAFIPEVLAVENCFAIGNRTEIHAENYLQVPRAELLMARLLQKYLQAFDIYKIGLTGSTGKTSTKEILAQILNSAAPCLKTLQNENNIIGLCKTILRVQPSHRFGVFELGTNHFGEIRLLADTLQPDAGIILNVGPSHLKYLEDEEGVFKEKSELFHRAIDLRLYPEDDPRFEAYWNLGVGIGFDANAHYQIQDLQPEKDGQSFVLKGNRYYIPYLAKHQVLNSAFAIAMALELGLTPQKINQALAQAVETGLRLKVEKLPDRWLILDCYNANPVSMQAAVEYWATFQPDKPHIAILGDMLELGKQSQLYHDLVAAILRETEGTTIYSVGDFSRVFSQDPARHYSNVDALLQAFPSFPPESVILLKASHGIHLERLIPQLKGEN